MDLRKKDGSLKITPQELKTKLDGGEKITIIDVREPSEWTICHLKEARLIPLEELPRRLNELDPNDAIILHCPSATVKRRLNFNQSAGTGFDYLKNSLIKRQTCHHGIRSMQALLFLKRHGFQQIKNLEGGYRCLGRRN